ncbi:hypothetical protein CFBP4996_26630 (plasmid) [Agrobacterium leguminum]|uniref:hypothetical protein n=1 Tax=Agrobacterium leguminum TaxID=2792015 RepID=UPI0010C9BA85|nr:hypothetical protein [Agrobacterium leguminum]WFS69605.1 hypothetical protein CFBP4996_26630 [Agrobacterium leguminum]
MRRVIAAMAYALRMTAWVILNMLRRPVIVVCGFLTVAGWVGGVILAPALLWYANAYKGSAFGWEMFAMMIGLGLIMGVVSPVVMVKYDSLLFRLQPDDRNIIYY